MLKITLLATLILIFVLNVPAQKKVSDREFEGYKGTVKSALIEYESTKNSDGSTPKKKRVKWGQYFFDKDGVLVQIIYPGSSKLTFSVIDGFKTFKSTPLESEKKDRAIFIAAPLVEPEPIEKPEKIVPPDKRFNQKYAYEYDSQGRVKIEREYLNDGRLTEKRTFVYDDKGRVIEEEENDTVALTKYVYKYDDTGKLIERLENRDIKGPGTDSTSKTVYSDYKFDAQGNWIQRKQTWFFEVQGKPLVAESVYYRTIVYY